MKHIDQHTVPRCYLKGFTFDQNGRRIYLFDKVRGVSHTDSIKKVSAHSNFYDIPTEILPPELIDAHNPKLIEKSLQKSETDFGVALQKLRKVRFGQRIERSLCEDLAYFIAQQFFRSEEYRKTLVEMWIRLNQNFGDDLIALNFPDDYHLRPRFEFDERYHSLLHAAEIFDPEKVESLRRTLLGHIWIFAIPRKEFIYTSDNPLVRQNLTPLDAPIPKPVKKNSDGTITTEIVASSFYPGFQERGIEIYYPINSKLLLIIKERMTFTMHSLNNRGVVEVDKKEFETNNRLQVEQSMRQVYCISNSFDSAKWWCQDNPEICNPDRARGKVVSGIERPKT